MAGIERQLGAPGRLQGVRLHDYAASGNCYKVRLLLSLLGRPYERVPVDLFAGGTLTRDFALLNPVRETPVLELEDGTILTQSPAILCISPRTRASFQVKRLTARKSCNGWRLSRSES